MHLLEDGQKLLILRYGKKRDCIELHQDVIEKYGYCWFGKIGVVPSSKVIESVMKEKNPSIILFSQGDGYVAHLEEIVFEKPAEGIPEYYDEELYAANIFPNSYYKLTSIQILSRADLEKLKIVSSGNRAIDTLNRSMSSFFFAENGKTKQTFQDDVQKVEYNISANSGCRYRVNGICSRRGFVSYQYECERPSMCSGQKD